MAETPCSLAAASVSVLVAADEPYGDEIDAGWLVGVVRAALVAAGVGAAGEVSLLITGDDTVRALNAEYRGLDEITDVLSFSAVHPGHWEGDGDGPDAESADESGIAAGFVLPPGVLPPLGEIVVSWPQAQRQAVGRGVGPRRELGLLVIHGALHLLGYDHVEAEDAVRMEARERRAAELLASLNSW